MLMTNCNSQKNQSLSVFFGTTKAFSTDPLDYDHLVHHISFRSVLSPLISLYKSGAVTPMIAESWEILNNYQTWKFFIRKDIYFENGDLITPKVVEKSLKRIFYLIKERNSYCEIVSRLAESSKLNTADASFLGISSDHESVTIQLKSPYKDTLDTLSFGLYSIVHPNDYNPQTGAWKNKSGVISSNFYKIKNWHESKLELVYRNDFSASIKTHHKPLKNIAIDFQKDPKTSYDLIYGSNFTQLTSEYIFTSSIYSRISYLKVQNWEKHPFLKIRKNREYLRALFYQDYEKYEPKFDLSFFQKFISGIESFKVKESKKIKINTSIKLKVPHFISTLPGSNYYLQEILKISKKDHRIIIESFDYNQDVEFDLSPLLTGITIFNPDSDIRFMFLSKEGIRLPDETGEIIEELKKEKFSYQRINELLWEQAIIWPLGHFAAGFWAKSDIDFSQLNNAIPPIEFQWIGSK